MHSCVTVQQYQRSNVQIEYSTGAHIGISKVVESTDFLNDINMVPFRLGTFVVSNLAVGAHSVLESVWIEAQLGL